MRCGFHSTHFSYKLQYPIAREKLVAQSVITKPGTFLAPYKCMMLKQFADRQFVANGISFQEQRLLAHSIVASYDLFISQCEERKLTPTFVLYTLWEKCQSDLDPAKKVKAN